MANFYQTFMISTCLVAALAACQPRKAAPINPLTNKSGATLTEAQKKFDVQHYTLDIGIFPKTKRVEGDVSVTFLAVADMSVLELDLDPRMDITAVRSGDADLAFSRDNNKFSVTLPEVLKAGAEQTVTVSYGGKPHIGEAPPWAGGFVWSTTLDGKPWVATAVQGQGCDLWWPCKDSYADKPDRGLDMKVSVPESVKVAMNGKLISESEPENGRHTFYWKTQHPTTGYAVALNVGPYERLQDSYTSVNGTEVPIEFWVLPENIEKATKLIETDVKPDLVFFENLLGPYPWGDEKVGFVETPHLGMEHQTINAYGEAYKKGEYGFDGLLHHELAHEWFGNMMTHKTASDAWLHEGYASYMQYEYAGRQVGGMAYAAGMISAYKGSENCEAVVNPEEVDVGTVLNNGDIYTKGAWMLHTLRRYVGEDVFWAGTRELLYGTDTPWNLPYPTESRYRSTDDFIEIMSRRAGRDIGWIVKAYLLAADMPTLDMSREGDTVTLQWNIPQDRPFPMPVTVSVNGAKQVVAMTGGAGQFTAPAKAEIILDPEMKVMRRMPFIGDCAERDEADKARVKKRRAEMAKQYRWQFN